MRRSVPNKFREACEELRSIEPNSVRALLRRDATLLLPQTIDLFKRHVGEVYPEAGLAVQHALRLASGTAR